MCQEGELQEEGNVCVVFSGECEIYKTRNDFKLYDENGFEITQNPGELDPVGEEGADDGAKEEVFSATVTDNPASADNQPGQKRAPLKESPSKLSKYSKLSKSPMTRKTKYEGED